MKMKQLETLVWIVRLGSFGAAADRLCTTQSTVSCRIHELEQDFGTILFDRTHRKVNLTAKGKELFLYAEKLIHLTSEMRERFANPASLSGLIRIGVAEVVSMSWLPKLVSAVSEKYPGVTLEMDVDLTQPLTTRLRSGELDLILVPGAVTDSNMVSESVGEVQFCWMASPEFKLPAGVLTPKDLETLRIISLSKESYHHNFIERWFTSGNGYYHGATRCNNISLVASLTMAGEGIGYLPVSACGDHIKAGRLVVLKTRPSMAPVEFFMVRSNSHPQPLVDAVGALVLESSDFGSGRHDDREEQSEDFLDGARAANVG